MSDAHSPVPAPSGASVVIETNATVKKSRLWVIVAVLAVVAFAAFSAVWFATREDYQPGPAARAIVSGMSEAGIDADIPDDQLRCIDEVYGDIVPTATEAGGFDPLNSMGDDPESDRLMGRVLDECFDKETRVTAIAASMVADGSATEEQADCAATALDDAFVDAGGYEAAFSDTDELMGLAFGLLASLSECGIDLFSSMGDPSAVDMDYSVCEIDFNTVSTALEAYQSANGKNAESWDDLDGEFLFGDYSDRFTIETGSDGTVTLTGIGECEGYTFSIGA